MKRATEKDIQTILASGYSHINMEEESALIQSFLRGRFITPDIFQMDQFAVYHLAPEPLRSLKNNIICLIAAICRAASTLGINAKYSYAMSDYYIYELEKLSDMQDVKALAVTMLQHYQDLVQQAKVKSYSLPVLRSIRYMDQHLYDSCRVQDIAAALHLNPNYLSSLFKKETGTNISLYQREKKLEEAKTLLSNQHHSISAIAEMLGFSSTSYFCRCFREAFHCTPRAYIASIIR